MYKFKDGLVFYSKEEANKAILSGHKLIKGHKDGNDKARDEVVKRTNKEADSSSRES